MAHRGGRPKSSLIPFDRCAGTIAPWGYAVYAGLYELATGVRYDDEQRVGRDRKSAHRGCNSAHFGEPGFVRLLIVGTIIL